jgi:hypothetical protein
MRRFLLCALGLGAALSCARPPSSTPLGGSEWVRPELSSDRRVQGEPGHAERTATAAPRAPEKTAEPVPDKPAPLVDKNPSELAFAFVPPKRGSTLTLDTRFSLRAVFGAALHGVEIKQDATGDAHERLQVRVTDADEQGVHELELEYLLSESNFHLGDSEDEDEDEDAEESNVGRRYRVRFEQGKPSVTRLNGSADEDAVRGVVFDLATVTGYLPLVRRALPIKLSPGWKAELSASEVTTVFGSLDAVHLDGAWLRLTGHVQGRPSEAVFECGLPVRIERDGFTLTARLSGSCTARVADTRPLEVNLQGPVHLETGASIAGATLSGTIEAHISHTYSP